MESIAECKTKNAKWTLPTLIMWISLHSTEEIIVMMWGSDGWQANCIVMCVKTTSKLSGPATSNYERYFPPLLYVENTKISL